MATMANFPMLPRLSNFEVFFQINFVMFQIADRKNVNIKWNIKNLSQKPNLVIARIRGYPRAVLKSDKT